MENNDYITSYPTDKGTRYRVRVPGENGERVQVGVFTTIEGARAARDAALIDAKELPRATVGYHPSAYPGIGEFARQMNAATEGAARAMANLGMSIDDVFKTPAPAINVPEPARIVTVPPLTLRLDRWLYASDFHAPLHSVEMVRRLIQVARSRKVNDLVIGGDFFDFDSISRHGRNERQAGINETLRIGGDLLYLLANECNVYILPGNHDDRLSKKIDDAIDFEAMVYASLRGRNVARRITVTDYAYLYVQGPARKWVVGHPNFYSRRPANGVADVAQMHQMSVIGAHNHVQGMAVSPNGKHIAIDPGCMTDDTLTPYMMRHKGLSKYPNWRKGFVFIDNDIPSVCADGLIDWHSMGAE